MISLLCLPWDNPQCVDRMWTSAYQHASVPENIELILGVAPHDPSFEQYYKWEKSWSQIQDSIYVWSIPPAIERSAKIPILRELATGPIYLVIDPESFDYETGWDVLVNSEIEFSLGELWQS